MRLAILFSVIAALAGCQMQPQSEQVSAQVSKPRAAKSDEFLKLYFDTCVATAQRSRTQLRNAIRNTYANEQETVAVPYSHAEFSADGYSEDYPTRGVGYSYCALQSEVSDPEQFLTRFIEEVQKTLPSNVVLLKNDNRTRFSEASVTSRFVALGRPVIMTAQIYRDRETRKLDGKNVSITMNASHGLIPNS